MSLGHREIVKITLPEQAYDIVGNIKDITGDDVDVCKMAEFLVRQAEYYMTEEPDMGLTDFVDNIANIIIESDNFSTKLRYFTATPLCIQFKENLPQCLQSFYRYVLDAIVHGQFKDCNHEYIRFDVQRTQSVV